jgi:hypothetical protein
VPLVCERMEAARSWAAAEFGDVEIGDARLGYRVVRMAARVAEAPNGVVAKVFESASERQAAYDLLGNSRVRSEAIVDAAGRATARRCKDARVVFLVADGTSASLADPSKTKELGSIGKRRFPTRGVKIASIYAVDDRGVPMGTVGLSVWARGPKREGSRFERRRDGQTEMVERWLPTLQKAAETTSAETAARLWIVVDREGDNARLLREAAALGTFTVRAAQNRRVEVRGRPRKLFGAVAAGKRFAPRHVALAATSARKARNAILEVRAVTVTLLLPLHDSANHRDELTVNVVQLRERRRDGLSWTLLTNAPIATEQDIEQVIASYRARWRIEEFHRTWKAGGCDLEATQLRSREAITKWATILAAVAARAERLKYLSRTNPDAPATTELSEIEILALITAKRRIKTSVEIIPDAVPTIGVATRWIAELGCWTGQYRKNYPHPGTMVIARGLEKLASFTEAVAAVLASPEIKRRLR